MFIIASLHLGGGRQPPLSLSCRHRQHHETPCPLPALLTPYMHVCERLTAKTYHCLHPNLQVLDVGWHECVSTRWLTCTCLHHGITSPHRAASVKSAW